jgi:hypothetical protein
MLVGAIPAQAARNCDGFWRQMHRIERRIERGVADCRLSYREERRLNRAHGEIRRLFRELKEDGDLSRSDCSILDRRVDRLKDRVRRMKHNDISCDNGRNDRNHNNYQYH